MPVPNRTYLGRPEFNRRWQQLIDRIERLVLDSSTMIAKSSAATLAEALAARRIRIGVGPVPALILGGTADVVIPWSTPLPTATYQVDVTPAMGLLGKGTVTVKSKTVNDVTVTVTATALISLGTSFIIAVATV